MLYPWDLVRDAVRVRYGILGPHAGLAVLEPVSVHLNSCRFNGLHLTLQTDKWQDHRLSYFSRSFSSLMSILPLDRWQIRTNWPVSPHTNVAPVLFCLWVTLTPALALCISHHCSIFHSSCWANPTSKIITGSHEWDYAASGWFRWQ